MTYRAAEVLIAHVDGDPRHCVVCHQRYQRAAGARAIANGMRVLCGTTMLCREVE